MQEDKKIEEYVISDDLEYENRRNWNDKLRDFIGGKYFIPIIIVLIAIIAFSLGRISGLQNKRPPVRIINNAPLTPILQSDSANSISNIQQTAAAASAGQGGSVVASKSGTKYHFPWCAGAKQISSKNLITFNSIEAARAAGYTPASNCKGLK
jgi:hypothetical protein